MKKIIAIAVVITVAFIGLTSYNGSGEKKEKKGLFAELTTGGPSAGGISQTTSGGTKRLD